jgi:hypothetical protein
VNVESVLHHPHLPAQEHHVKGCVPSRRNHLKLNSAIYRSKLTATYLRSITGYHA